MGIVLDIIIIAIIAFFVVMSARRGFIKTVIELVGFFLALYLSINLSGLLSNFVYDGFVKQPLVDEVDARLETVVKENIPTLDNHEVDLDKIDLSKLNINGIPVEIIDYDAVFSLLPDSLKGITNNYGLSADGLQEHISKNEDNQLSFAEIIIDYAAKPIIINLIRVILFIVLFTALTILVKFLARLLNKAFKIPIINGINKTLGGIFGFAKGTVIATAICISISVLITFTSDGFLIFTKENIDSSYIFKFLASFNPIN